MARLYQFTAVGNLAADPELRYTPSGAAVVNFTVASTPQRYDRNQGGYVDQETMWVKCVAWRRLAENVAETLRKGMPVIVSGNLSAKSWENSEGQRRTDWELTVESAGPDLNTAVAVVSRDSHSAQGSAGGTAGQSQQRGQAQGDAGQSAGFPGVPDPEAHYQQSRRDIQGQRVQDDEPPF